MSLSIEVALYSHLMGSAAVVALIGNRFQPAIASEQSARPYVLYTRLGADHQYHMASASGLLFAFLQLDVFADTYANLEQVCEALRNRLDGYRGIVTAGADSLWLQQVRLDNERDDFVSPTDGSDRGTFHRSVDLRVSASEPLPILTA